MRDQGAPRARRVPVVAEEPLVGSDRYDYADAFEIRVREPDRRVVPYLLEHAAATANRTEAAAVHA
jgi:hypothetical protein